MDSRAIEGDDVRRVLRADGSADPGTDPGLDPALVVDIYRAMVRTRIVDERLVALQRQGRIGFHIGSIGEEACILGSTAAMRAVDWILPCYREFGALLYRGMPLETYLDNMFGNADDVVKGRQMPDHYSGKPYRFGSVSSPIGTQITQATGMAWAAKLKKESVAVAVYFGEGATSSNDFHTGLNFAGVYQTPTIFLCRNNGWAISVPSAAQTASESFADKAIAYGMPGVRCDGNDVLAVYRTVREALARALAGGGPTLVEMLTYRMSGHSTSDDPRAYRDQDEVDEQEKRDPLARTRAHLEGLGAWDAGRETAWRAEVEAELTACIDRSEAKDKPALETMFEGVFATAPAHLRAQAAECLAGPRAKGHH